MRDRVEFREDPSTGRVVVAHPMPKGVGMILNREGEPFDFLPEIQGGRRLADTLDLLDRVARSGDAKPVAATRRA